MKRRVLSLALLAMLVLSLTAQASTWSLSGRPKLSISGTTATCSVNLESSDPDDELKVTLALWCGDNIVDSWTETGYGEVSIRETCRVVKGNTYALVMKPVVNGVAKSTVTVSADS